MALHRDLTGSDLHEPKGIEEAAQSTVYVSDGAGSGEWKRVGVDEIDSDAVKNVNKFKLHYKIEDISTASTHYIPISEDAILTSVTGILNGTISGANTRIEFKNGGLTSMGFLDVNYTSSGAGVLASMIPSTNTTIIGPSYVVLVCDGASTGAVDMNLVLDFDYV